MANEELREQENIDLQEGIITENPVNYFWMHLANYKEILDY